MGTVAKNAMSSSDLDVLFVRDRNVTIAALSIQLATKETVVFTGSSKREPGDPYNEGVGDDLALARAFQNAADYFISSAGYKWAP